MPEDLKRFYDDQAVNIPHADLYESSDVIDYMVYNRRLRLIAKMARKAAPESLLDVGCGEGYATGLVLPSVSRGISVGVDLSELRLTRCRERCPGVALLKASALELPFPDKSFDMVLSTELLEHLPDDTPAIEDFLRVARRYLLVSVPNVNGNVLSVFNRKGTREFPLDPKSGHFREYDTREFVRRMEKDFGARLLRTRSCGMYYTGIRFLGKHLPTVFKIAFGIYEPVLGATIKHLGYYSVMLFDVRR